MHLTTILGDTNFKFLMWVLERAYLEKQKKYFDYIGGCIASNCTFFHKRGDMLVLLWLWKSTQFLSYSIRNCPQILLDSGTLSPIAQSVLTKWMGTEGCIQEMFCRTSPNMWFLVPRLAVALILQCLHLWLILNMQLSALSWVGQLGIGTHVSSCIRQWQDLCKLHVCLQPSVVCSGNVMVVIIWRHRGFTGGPVAELIFL